MLKAESRDTTKLLDRALMWLHELEVIRLNKGLAVFRPAMTVRLAKEEKRGFAKVDFEPLSLHYKEQVLQVHVMAAFAQHGLAATRDALRLAADYFTLKEESFLDRWLPGRDREIGRQTTPDSWRAIVESLGNPIQQRIVADDREQTNVLVLAGPGSGKTRVLVHRIAYLVRVRRENARGILALAYNRHAAVDIRRRLHALIGDDARGVTVLTCHGLAMRLAGASFSGRAETPDDSMFDDVMRRAEALLRGEGLPPEEADEQRDRLLAGFRWILVDEYQDIDGAQYDLISALAGRTLEDEDGKLTLFAVGDDDQNIYAFAGASVEFIRRFEADYGPRSSHLVDNYRSTGHIIAAANAVIEPARERMKAEHPIHIDKARAKDPPGGAWEALDPVGRGRVQILPAGRDPVAQAQVVMGELLRLESLDSEWDWSRCAVIAREWKYLAPVRAFCEAHGIPAQMADEEIPNFWRLRETRAFVAWLRAREPRVVDGGALRAWADARPSDPWHDLLRQAIDEHALETGGGEVPVDHVVEWLAEWGRDVRRRQHGLLLLTAHRAKGLEFDHVAVLDGGWDRRNADEDPDAPRRLYYVAMTRARQTLALARFDGPHPLQEALRDHPSVTWRPPTALPTAPPALRHRHVRATLEDVDLGFAGRRSERDPIHRAIAALSPGDLLKTRITDRGRWQLLDETGTVVGHLAKVSGRRTGCAAAHPPCLPSSAGTARTPTPSFATPSSATPGRWSCPNWCSSPANRETERSEDALTNGPLKALPQRVARLIRARHVAQRHRPRKSCALGVAPGHHPRRAGARIADLARDVRPRLVALPALVRQPRLGERAAVRQPLAIERRRLAGLGSAALLRVAEHVRDTLPRQPPLSQPVRQTSSGKVGWSPWRPPTEPRQVLRVPRDTGIAGSRRAPRQPLDLVDLQPRGPRSRHPQVGTAAQSRVGGSTNASHCNARSSRDPRSGRDQYACSAMKHPSRLVAFAGRSIRRKARNVRNWCGGSLRIAYVVPTH